MSFSIFALHCKNIPVGCFGNIISRHLVVFGTCHQKSSASKEYVQSIPPKQLQESFYENNLETIDIKPMFPELILTKETKVDFYETDEGIQLQDAALKAVGRFLRLFVSKERYDNWWENSLETHDKYHKHLNSISPFLLPKFGGEWALCAQVLQLKGAFKLVTDDRWVEQAENMRTPEKKDCTVEAVDLRNSSISSDGMNSFDGVGYVKYLNVADSVLFDNHCMNKLHSISHSLEYLDISGTAVTPEGFGYLRLCTNLRWLNVSRLKNNQFVQNLLPFLKEILPPDCVVVGDDNIPSLSYGSEIPYRCPYNPAKDTLLEFDPGIGDLELFKVTYQSTSLQLYDPTAVHQLWKTPLVNKKREAQLKTMRSRNTPSRHTLVKYIQKGENSKPLF